MRKQKSDQPRDDGDRPVEITMTDLGWTKEGEERAERDTGDSHAAGTPGGGTASGGLAGTNRGHGDPDDIDLEDALGSGILDTNEEDEEGTPAEKRARGGREKTGGYTHSGEQQ